MTTPPAHVCRAPRESYHAGSRLTVPFPQRSRQFERGKTYGRRKPIMLRLLGSDCDAEPQHSFVIPSRSTKGTGFFYGVITTEIDGWLVPKPLRAAVQLNPPSLSIAAGEPIDQSFRQHASHKRAPIAARRPHQQAATSIQKLTDWGRPNVGQIRGCWYKT